MSILWYRTGNITVTDPHDFRMSWVLKCLFSLFRADTMSSESAEPPGWLRLGDLAIGDGGVCVTSLIKDKIREYMLNEEHQQTPSSSAKTTAAAASKSGGTCVRRIGNSLDLLLRESRNAGHAVAATTAKNKPSAAAAATVVADVRCAVSTTISAPADSSRPTVDGPPPPLPPTFAKR